ncbi:3-deoxy-7-phosphoheptulonate synthase [bacterium]|nr:3-deoxy-7-phosphoheptulonate synthase [bacterium]MBR5623483.1 3-deoxy-7-phosphoheptulonate synthase [bacterium]MBR5624370.1 3-deoxy-7-phosphoheptulonate synthase [bacterium]MBR5946346.1 3-deoxy-7-phosphoheptulonate synthase [bacterium]MBR6463541.1 3-deoxy-7-phosphoheptulonate synthase [bacterium]
MIIIIKQGAQKSQVDNLINWLKAQNIDPHISVGSHETLIGCVGDVAHLDIDLVSALDVVASVQRVGDPYKAANRKFHPDDSIIDCGGVLIGGGNFQVIAGPCSVESEEQIIEVAKAVKAAGATLLRGGAFKPRTSPYSFQGLGVEGLKMLLAAKKETGLPIVTELMNFSQFEYFNDVDVIQIGARNMQNFDILKEVGHNTKKPILLKRGLSSTLQELLMSAEYIMASGNPNVILCERGIRTFETATRNTIDLSVVPLLHQFSHLPVVVDPSHATGVARLVHPVAVAATAIGADGLIIEVHNDPPKAKCDGAQSQTPAMFAETMKAIKAVRPYACR